MADFDFMDALYRAYVPQYSGAALWWLALRVGGSAVEHNSTPRRRRRSAVVAW